MNTTIQHSKLTLLVIASVAAFNGCASQRILSVKSYPADAEVCLKGRPGSEYFSGQKQCVGLTPFTADKIELAGADGKKRKVNLADIEGDKEQFDLIVSREGYAPQSVTVPSWEHFISLKAEAPREVASLPVAPAPVPAVAPAVEEQGAVKISSNPVGALVYVNDYVKDNTPFTMKAKSGEVLRIKLEQPGFSPTEKSITVESGRTLEVNLLLEQQKEVPVVQQVTKTETVLTQAAQ